MFEKFFRLKKHGTNIKTEVIAGLTTFMTMAYILAVNPEILSNAGMEKNALYTATALAAVTGTLVMAFWARLPYALAPGMGLNAFFAYTVVLGLGYPWQMAITAVFIEGLIFIILTALNIREAIINAIPMNIKHSISAGIGLFIAFIGLQNAGIIVNNQATLVTLGDMTGTGALIAMAGLIISGVFLFFRVRGALLIGIFAATLLGIPAGITHLPEGALISLPPSLEPIAFKFDFSRLFTLDMLIVIFIFLFVDMFDTVGTLVGVSSKAGFLDKKGRIPRAREALFADAIATTAGAMMGTSTTTTYVESASGVAEGGRTGMTALTVALLFAASLFLSPLFIMIPAAATAPALILVGLFMMSPVAKIDFNDMTEAIPAFFTIIMMPLAYSISEGIVFGTLSYVILKTLSGKWKEVSWVMYILSIFFILKFLV